MAIRLTQSMIEVGVDQAPNIRLTQSVIELGIGLGIDCNNPPPGTVGTAYSHTFLAGAGEPPYSFAIILGALPNGLTLAAATGIASGIPTLSGLFTFTVQVTDAFAGTASVICSILIRDVGLSISLYGFKRYRTPKCDEPNTEAEAVPPVQRVL